MTDARHQAAAAICARLPVSDRYASTCAALFDRDELAAAAFAHTLGALAPYLLIETIRAMRERRAREEAERLRDALTEPTVKIHRPCAGPNA